MQLLYLVCVITGGFYESAAFQTNTLGMMFSLGHFVSFHLFQNQQCGRWWLFR